MATRVPLTMRERNDEVLKLTITPDDPAESLAGVTALALYLKPDNCADDDDIGVLVLTSADPTQITIDTHTSDEITATAYIPASALHGAYQRVWRTDAHSASASRTALYGPVTVVAL